MHGTHFWITLKKNTAATHERHQQQQSPFGLVKSMYEKKNEKRGELKRTHACCRFSTNLLSQNMIFRQCERRSMRTGLLLSNARDQVVFQARNR